MTLPRPPQAVVFDMDGVLLDSETLFREAARVTALAKGVDLPLEVYLRTLGLPHDATQAFFHDLYGTGFDFEDFWRHSAARFHELAETQLRVKAGVVELLDALDGAGLPRAVATSSSRPYVQKHLTAHGLIERFHAVVAFGDYARGKPNPDPFLLAAERLGVAPEHCLALEDSHNGVRAAAAAGMMTIMVPDLLDPTEEIERLCVRVAQDLHEVRDLVCPPSSAH
jgi:HAD superfamily hydrolase (TIGR01509 family)